MFHFLEKFQEQFAPNGATIETLYEQFKKLLEADLSSSVRIQSNGLT